MRDMASRLGKKALRLYFSSQQAIEIRKTVDEPRRPQLIDYQYMTHDESRRILKTLLERNIWLHFIYTGGMRSRFNH